MPLSPGDRLGPYEILAPIGAGGMGEVYKARDTRLDRIVAVKLSKTEFSERFEREARAVAALNHSNICTLHDVGPNYLVMEYIEGAPLKGPLPLVQTLKYAVQICDALDAAHKKGITHRDLKPANILVTKAGIKLLDFGLAKLDSSGIGQATKPDDATLTMALTGKNEIVGTLYYMSPEQLQAQANGQEVDSRSDILSFGLVLYEMLTGKRAFEGSSPASVIAAIMERPAPSIADVAPPALDRVLKKCLAKDPEERWQTARDLKDELEWIANASREATSVLTAVAHRRPMPWIAAGVLALALSVAGMGWYRATRPAELKPLVRYDVDLGPDVSLNQSRTSDVILSPDGARMAYESHGKLFTRKLDQNKATELAATGRASTPFFSADGQWIAYFAAGKLNKIAVEGGTPVVLCDAPFGAGGSWGEDGTIVAALTGSSGPLSRVPSAGGAPTPLSQLAQGEFSHDWPQVLPGGNAVLFTARFASGMSVEVMSLEDHSRKTVQKGGSFGQFFTSPDGQGYLLYINNGTLFATGFDPSTWQLSGTPVPVLERVIYDPSFGGARFAFSEAGTAIYQSGNAPVNGHVMLQWLDNAGRVQPLLAKPGSYTRLKISPDGQRIAMDLPSGVGRDIWMYEWQRNVMTRLTFDSKPDPRNSLWSPDGRYIVFSQPDGLFWMRSDGGGKPKALTQSNKGQFPFSFTPDGKWLTWQEGHIGANDLYIMQVESDGNGLRGGKPEVFLQSVFDEIQPRFSPDGHWLAYASNESGAYQVYVRAFPDKGGKWQISSDGGDHPVWSRNGRELFYRSLDGRIMVTPYTGNGGSFVADQSRVWSEQRVADNTVAFDVSLDGKRILAMTPEDTLETRWAENHVTVLENFFDELRRKVPTGK